MKVKSFLAKYCVLKIRKRIIYVYNIKDSRTTLLLMLQIKLSPTVFSKLSVRQEDV